MGYHGGRLRQAKLERSEGGEPRLHHDMPYFMPLYALNAFISIEPNSELGRKLLSSSAFANIDGICLVYYIYNVDRYKLRTTS